MFRYKRYRHMLSRFSFHLSYIGARNYFVNKNDDTDNYYKCVVVRNPWTRCVSFFHMFYKHLPMNEQREMFKQKVMGSNLKPMHIHYMHHDHVCVDKIYQFENFNTTIQDMDKILNVDAPIKPHIKQYTYDDYKSWFDQELIDFVFEKEHKTIELIGYTF